MITSKRIHNKRLPVCAVLFALLFAADQAVAQEAVPVYTTFEFASSDAMGVCTAANQTQIQLSLSQFFSNVPSLVLWNFVGSKPEGPELSYTRLRVALERGVPWLLRVRLFKVSSNSPVKMWTVPVVNQVLDDRTSPDCKNWPGLIQEAVRLELLERKRDEFESELRESAPLAKGLKPLGTASPPTKEEARGVLPLSVDQYATISGAMFSIKFPSPGVALLSKGVDCSNYPPPPSMTAKAIVVQYLKWRNDIGEDDIEKHLAELDALRDAENEIYLLGQPQRTIRQCSTNSQPPPRVAP